MMNETNTENKIDLPAEVVGNNPEKVILDEQNSKEDVYKDSITRLKEARALKKEKKKAVKEMTTKFGNVKFAKKLVKTAVGNLQKQIRRTTGRGG
jgi:hypothetical protein